MFLRLLNENPELESKWWKVARHLFLTTWLNFFCFFRNMSKKEQKTSERDFVLSCIQSLLITTSHEWHIYPVENGKAVIIHPMCLIIDNWTNGITADLTPTIDNFSPLARVVEQNSRFVFSTLKNVKKDQLQRLIKGVPIAFNELLGADISNEFIKSLLS